jgi:hypothetical protein
MARAAIGWLIVRAALVAFIAADLGRRLGAGEGNRTPTVSLGSCFTWLLLPARIGAPTGRGAGPVAHCVALKAAYP